MLSPQEKYPLKKLGKNLIFLNNFITNPHIEIGDYTYYNDLNGPEAFERKNVVFGYFAKLMIGKFCQIGQGTTFFLNDANHQMNGFSTFPFFVFGRHNESCSDWDSYDSHLPYKGDNIVGNDVWFGQQSAIMPAVTIGDGAIIGAHAVVTKDIPPYTIVAGNPAKIIRQRFPNRTIKKLLDIRWWDWEYNKITRNIEAIVSADIKKLESAR